MKTVLTHIILIAIIIVTLFPLFWLVTASFRGDNAVFSSHILPERWTLYNYREILFPEKNVYSLLNDFNSSLYAIGNFNDKSYDYRENYIESNLPKLYSLNRESLKSINVVRDKALNLKSNLNEKGFTNNVFNWFDTLKINKPNLDATETNAVIYNVLKNLYTFHKKDKDMLKWYGDYLSKYGVKSSMIYPRMKPYVIFRTYKNAYNNYFVGESEFYSLQRSLKSVNEKIENTQSSISRYKNKIVSINSLLKDIDEFIANYINNFEIAKNVLGKNPNLSPLDKEKYNQVLKLATTIKSIIPQDSGYSSLNKFLNINLALLNYKPNFSNHDSFGYIFDDYIQKYNIVYRRLQEAQKLFSEKAEYEKNLNTLNSNLAQLKSDKDKKYSEYTAMEKHILNKQKVLNEFYSYTLYSFAKQTRTLTNLQSAMGEISKYSNLKTDEFLAYQKKINYFLRMKSSILELFTTLDKLTNETNSINSNTDNFSKRYKTYFELSKAGINKFNSPYLDNSLSVLNTIQNVTLADFNREIKSIDNSLKILNRKRDMELLSIKDRINHVYAKKIKHEFVRWIFNTIIVATISGIIVTIVVAITAYPFSRFRFKGRKGWLLSFLIIQMFPTVMAMVAFYNIVRFLGNIFPFIGLNTLGGLVLVYLGGIAYNTWLAKGYYDTVPKSLEEAALIDGANRFQTFWIIVFPLVRPILAVIFIFTFIGAFNDFVMPKILLQNQDLYTYAIGLYQFVTGPYETEWGLFSAASLIGAMPIAVVFMLLQNFLVSGLTKGAVKG